MLLARMGSPMETAILEDRSTSRRFETFRASRPKKAAYGKP